MKKLLALLVVLLALVGLLVSDLVGHSAEDGLAMASAPGVGTPATVKRGRAADNTELRQVIRQGSDAPQ